MPRNLRRQGPRALSEQEAKVRSDGAAKMLAWGMPEDQVCRLYNLTPAGLDYLKEVPGFDTALETYKEEFQLQGHRLAAEMILMQDQALENIREILHSPNVKDTLKAETSWKVLEQVMPSKPQKGDVNVNVGVNQASITHFSETADKLARVLEEAKDVTPVDDDPHLHDAPDGTRPNGGGQP